jgi:uroporphyrinogen-III decarboxylase
MTSRERVEKAINHIEPDRVPIDFGATGQTGISAKVVYALREAYNLPKKPVKIQETFQLLGEIDDELRNVLETDVIGLWGRYDLYGNNNESFKRADFVKDVPVMIPSNMEYFADEKYVYVYPQGNNKVAPSGKMPIGGSFFDNIDRSGDFDEDNLTPLEDFAESFSVINDDDARYYEIKSKQLFEETQFAVVGNLGGGGLGDAALISGPYQTNPKGIRRMDDWLAAHILYPDYIKTVFEMQTEIMIKNLEIYKQAVGNRIQIIWISGTDFGTNKSEFIRPELFRELYKPFYTKINQWVHNNTDWKTFYHTCGSIVKILPDIIEMGVDIINPVQVSANGMDAKMLKEKFGSDLVFWGGGSNNQTTLTFGTPEQVENEVLERLTIFSKNGGYVFNTIHNILENTPIENVKAVINAYKKFNT